MKFIALALLGAYVATAAATTPTTTANVAKEKDFCFVGGLGLGYTTTKMIKACDDKAAPDNGCYCGRGSLQNNVFVNALLVKKGEFCFVAPMVGTHKNKGIASAKSVKACASTDGSAKNTEADGCYCGTDALLVKNDEFCYGPNGLKGKMSAKMVKACASQDGSAKNTEADGCYCGTDALLVKNDAYCYGMGLKGKMSAKMVKDCASTDGSAKNTEADGCYCGSDALLVTNDAFCYAPKPGSKGKMSAKMVKACASTDGSAANTEADGCYCGNDDLLVKKDAFCYLAPQVGTQVNKGMASATSVEVCASTDGSAKNTKADGCYCGYDAALLVKKDEFCFDKSKDVFLKGKMSAKSVKVCASTDGSAKNTEADGCYCGNDALLVKKDEYCYGPTSTMSAKMVKACASTDGSKENTEADGCYCGMKVLASTVSSASTTTVGIFSALCLAVVALRQ